MDLTIILKEAPFSFLVSSLALLFFAAAVYGQTRRKPGLATVPAGNLADSLRSAMSGPTPPAAGGSAGDPDAPVTLNEDPAGQNEPVVDEEVNLEIGANLPGGPVDTPHYPPFP